MTSFEWGAEKLVHEERLTRLFDYLLCYEDAFVTIIDDSNSLLSLLDSRKFSDIKFSNAIYYLLKEANFF